MQRTVDTEGLLLPEGTRLLHIGPHKTGTTTIQGAFHGARADLLSQGVRYAGRSRQQAQAAHAVTGRAWHLTGGGAPAAGSAGPALLVAASARSADRALGGGGETGRHHRRRRRRSRPCHGAARLRGPARPPRGAARPP